jgi:hypothetical protein
MHLSACIALALVMLAGAQSYAFADVSVFANTPQNTTPSDSTATTANTQFAQPFVNTYVSGDSVNGYSPPSNQMSQNSNQPTVQQSFSDNPSVNSLPQSQQTPTSFNGISPTVDLSVQQSGSMRNSISVSSVPLLEPSSAFQPTASVPLSTSQNIAVIPFSAQQTIPASATQQTVIVASATQKTGIPVSASQQTAIPISATQQTPLINTDYPTVSVIQQQSSSSAIVVQQSTIQQSVNPTYQPKSTAPFISMINIVSSPTPSTLQSTRKVLPATVFSSVFPSNPSMISTLFATTSTILTPETPTHIQIIFNNTYTRTILNGTNITDYCEGLVPSIATAAGVPTYRITNVTIYSQPQTDFLVLRFILQPLSLTDSTARQVSTVSSLRSTDTSIKQVVNTLRSKVYNGEFRVTDQNSTLWSVNPNSNDVIFVSWTDDGPCPSQPCTNSETCDCSLNGKLSCQSLSVSPVSSGNFNRLLLLLLLLLLLIPLVILIICVCVRRKPRDTQKAEKRVIRADMLSYHEYVAREHNPQQPKIATIASRSTVNENTLNTLHRSLGENISIAFNGSTFVDHTGFDNSDSTSSDFILPGDK